MTQNYFRPTHNVNMSELSELLASKTEYGGQRCDDLGRLCDEYGVPYELGPYAHAI